MTLTVISKHSRTIQKLVKEQMDLVRRATLTTLTPDAMDVDAITNPETRKCQLWLLNFSYLSKEGLWLLNITS